MAYVYGHYKADTGELFYIGKGTGQRAWHTKGRNDRWKKIVAKHGLVVEILVDNLSEEDAYAKEIELIAEIGLENLANMQEGGQGLTITSAQQLVNDPEWKVKHARAMQDPEHRKKMKALNTERWQDPTFREKHKQGIQHLLDTNPNFYKEKAKRNWQDPTYREKMRDVMQAAGLKKSQDPVFIAKMTEINRKKAQDPIFRKNLQAAIDSPEYKKKMELKWQNPDVRAKHKAAMQKNAQDPEWRQKITAAAHKRWSDPAYRQKMEALYADPEWQRKSKAQAEKQKKEVTLISPMGEQVHVRGLAEFARAHNLYPSRLSQVIHKKIPQYKGWRLYDPDHPINQFIEDTSG